MPTSDLPLVHPERERAAFQPLKALHHFRKLIADKEDTEQVFHITNNLRSQRYFDDAMRFLSSDAGRELMARNENLVAILDDHETLKAMPAGSLGCAYVEFMERENITAQGLVEENAKFASKIPSYPDQLEWFGHRLRDTHDLVHVLTGYGRDPLGEQCVLAFSYSQNFSLGFLFIAYAGGFEVKRRMPAKAKAPVFSAIREAQRHGKAAANIGHADISALLARPLEEVRAEMNIVPPTRYQEAMRIYADAGVNPHNLLVAA
ncbi:MAG: Coq4 family protein [Pseudomonadota bacterium]